MNKWPKMITPEELWFKDSTNIAAWQTTRKGAADPSPAPGVPAPTPETKAAQCSQTGADVSPDIMKLFIRLFEIQISIQHH